MATQSCIDLQKVCAVYSINLVQQYFITQEEREVLQSIYEGDDAFKELSETSFSYRVSYCICITMVSPAERILA